MFEGSGLGHDTGMPMANEAGTRAKTNRKKEKSLTGTKEDRRGGGIRKQGKKGERKGKGSIGRGGTCSKNTNEQRNLPGLVAWLQVTGSRAEAGTSWIQGHPASAGVIQIYRVPV